MHKKNKKADLLRAAERRFAKHGVEKTTLNEIARDLRLSKATLYHYFVDKDALYREAVILQSERFLEKVKDVFNDESLPATDKFVQFFMVKLRLRQEQPLLFNLLTSAPVTELRPLEKELLAGVIASELAVVKLLLESLQHDAFPTLAADAHRLIVAQSYGMLYLYRSEIIDAGDGGEELLIKMVTTFLQPILSGAL